MLKIDTNVEGLIQMLKDRYKCWYRLYPNVAKDILECGNRMDTNIKRWIQMLKNGYKCYDGLWIWYMMNTNVKGWIQMSILVGFKSKDGMNVMMDFEFNTG